MPDPIHSRPQMRRTLSLSRKYEPRDHHPAWYKVIGALSDEDTPASRLADGRAQRRSTCLLPKQGED